ncbi:S9 family peptidase [Pleionea sp. CnH1-48]|uniref:S9 family peptidase n=1 Tax=Pleionea sp. CnH1-48 TaxID=2954494 RepID=UPI0020977E7B|nr:S9 family peptidase [Pleionea sp. CnH1-48]MCO7227233.1 S9 family peptidase [Pleionea sp. CnH1-48]
MPFKIHVMLAFVAALLIQTVAAKPADIPVKDFFRNAEFTGLQLSPSGKYLAVISPIKNRRNIVVMETKNLKKIKVLTAFDKQNVGGYFWANEDELVFTMDSDGNEAFSIFKVNREGKPKVVELVGSSVGNSGIRSASVVHTLPDDPKHIIVQFNGRRVTAPDLYLLPLDSRWSQKRRKNAKMKIIARNPGDVQGWLVDHDGDVRGATSLKGLKGKFHYKEKGEKDFRVLREFNVLEEGIAPLGFDFDNKTMFVSSNKGRDRGAIYYFDPKTNKLGDMIFEHDEVDVSGLIMSRKRQKLLGVSYFDDYPRSKYFDEEEAKMRKGLKDAFKGKMVSISSASDDEMLNILLVSDDTDPGSYYLYDRKEGKVQFLVSRMNWIKPEQMSPMKPIRYKSRDGLTMRGYLTVPKDSNGKKLPLIVNPHGGPFGVRDFWGYNPEHQFFASRGYATLQVNYRGSGGYGRKFQHAGYGGKWGAEMQNDLTDGVKYLIDEGIVDPERVCIYGASYGGYATMAGLTFTPDLYKCGINYVGVTDVGLLFTSMPKHWEPAKELLKIQIGDPEDKELMARMSPLAHVDKIKAPLMIVHGAKDPRVVKQHATDLRDALEDRKIELSDDEWIMKFDEGHGFRKEENRVELYEKIEKFLAKHL